MSAYSKAMARYFDFSSRSTRAEYWKFAFTVYIAAFAGSVIDRSAGWQFNGGRFGPLAALILLVHAIPLWAALARRLHDTNRSAWRVLWVLVPIVGVILLLIWACSPSKAGDNRYDGVNVDAPPDPEPSALSGESVDDPVIVPKAQKPPLRTLPAEPVIAPLSSIEANRQLERLERLQALRRDGLVSDEEFQAMKAKIVGARA